MKTCEDFPCCGHRQGECEDQPEFTSEYWAEVMDSFEDPADYDNYCEMIDRQKQEY